VVDRYFRVKNFVPETFWTIKVKLRRKEIDVNFSWARNRLFDRPSVIILYEQCIRAKIARITKIEKKPKEKWKPLPLTTVELQKAATRLLGMAGQHAMNIAESLYNKGFISYPRTETDRFDKAINLRALVEKQANSNPLDRRWGQYSRDLLNGGFRQPRNGRNDDKAHPPIHPVTYVNPGTLSHEENRLYEYIVRRFLACCSENAKGLATEIEMLYGGETFTATGLIVLERNYLDIFVYEKWNSSPELPDFGLNEQFMPTEALMNEGRTSAPNYLTEADLIALMDANGIGTDATMAEHIQKIQDREYVNVVSLRGNGQADDSSEDRSDADEAPAGGGRGGRGRVRGARGRGGAASSGPRQGHSMKKYFVPTKLGVALILGFDRMNFETSLGKPFLRKEMETKMKEICEGRTTKAVVLEQSIRQYQGVFNQSQEKVNVLKAASTDAFVGRFLIANKGCFLGMPGIRLCMSPKTG